MDAEVRMCGLCGLCGGVNGGVRWMVEVVRFYGRCGFLVAQRSIRGGGQDNEKKSN